MTESEYLEMPWSIEDTIENLNEIKEMLKSKLVNANMDGKAESDVKELEFDFDRAIQALEEVQAYRAIGTVEEIIQVPCKPGDKIYTNMAMSGWYMKAKDRPYEATVVFVGINGEDNFINVELGKGKMLQFPFSQLNQTWFLSRERAERALSAVSMEQEPEMERM